MAFEPLRTDEKLDAPAAKTRDMDAQMLHGCSGFLIAAVAGYALSVWPWFAFQGAEQLRVLALCALAGLVPAGALGIVATRRFGLAGACGFVAGAVTVSIFLYLRLQQVFVAALDRQAAQPDYPLALVYVVPAAWLCLVLFTALLCLPKDEWKEPG